MKLYTAVYAYIFQVIALYLAGILLQGSISCQQTEISVVCEGQIWGHHPSRVSPPPFLQAVSTFWLWTVFLDISNRNSSSSFVAQWYALQLANKSMSRGLSSSLAMLSVCVWDVADKSLTPGKEVGSEESQTSLLTTRGHHPGSTSHPWLCLVALRSEEVHFHLAHWIPLSAHHHVSWPYRVGGSGLVTGLFRKEKRKNLYVL